MWANPQDFNVNVGETWAGSIEVYTDDTQSESVNLAGAVCVIVYDEQIAQTSILVPATGNTAGVVSWSQDTTGWQAGIGKWTLKVTLASGEVDYPAAGSLFTSQLETRPEPTS